MAITTENGMPWQTRTVTRVFDTQVAHPAFTMVNENEILQVLDRAAQDSGFIADILDEGSAALRDYSLTLREKAALVTGDIRWIEAHIGELTDRQCTLLNCVLQREAW
jgi:hypothetical protein